MEWQRRHESQNWFLTPARFENHQFTRYSNNNLDDIANAVSDFDVSIKLPQYFEITTDLNEQKWLKKIRLKPINFQVKTDLILIYSLNPKLLSTVIKTVSLTLKPISKKTGWTISKSTRYWQSHQFCQWKYWKLSFRKNHGFPNRLWKKSLLWLEPTSVIYKSVFWWISIWDKISENLPE